MAEPYTVRMTRKSGEHKDFVGPNQAAAMDAAMAWVRAETDVVAAAKRLLVQLAPDREMLEECEETGETERAFRDLEAAVRAAETES